MSGAELTLRLVAVGCALALAGAAVWLSVWTSRNRGDEFNYLVIGGLLLLAGCAGTAGLAGTAALPW